MATATSPTPRGDQPAAGAAPGRPRLRDERLCWLAVRDQLRGSGRNNPILALVRVLSAARPRPAVRGPVEIEDGPPRGRLWRYAFAVDDVARRLSEDERKVLRATGTVPDWFLPAVRRRYRELRQGR